MKNLTTEDEDAIELMLNHEDYCEKLTRWEVDFLESISERGSMSVNQEEIFNNLCKKILK